MGDQIGAAGIRAIEERGISAETAVRFGIYTARRSEDGEVSASDRGNILVFPFWERGTAVNEKYRAPGKKFWQRASGRKTFWNSDVLDDPALVDGRSSLIITEGEFDALTAIDCGFPLTVSVPEGAPPVKDDEDPEKLGDADPASDQTGKFEFIWNNRERLKLIKRFIIAVDGDRPGKRLGAELVRRLQPARCLWVAYPEGCKDLNDVLRRHGAEAVSGLLNAAQPYPVHGLYRLSEFPELPAVRTYKTGWWTLDRHLQPFLGELMFVLGIPGHGKALALDTPIPTPAGWTTMRDASVGDTVYDENGKPCRIIRTSEVMTGRPCYLMRFDDGTEVVADAEHQWKTTSDKARRSALMAARRNGKPRTPNRDQRHKRTFSSVVTTAEIASTLISQGKRNHHIQIAGPIEGTESLVPVDPYTLGVWLGDGTSLSGSISCFDQPIVEKLAANGETLTIRVTRGVYGIKGILPRLRQLDVISNKHIPLLYSRASISQRCELMRGLMDTDGSCQKDRRCEFTSCNERLARDVLELALGLGLKATMVEGDATLYGRIISRKYRVCFVSDQISVFHLDRKRERQRLGTPHRVNRRVVVSCCPVESVPVKCIQVDSPSHLFLATRSFIPTHNSAFVANLLANLSEQYGWRSVVFSPEEPTVPHMRDKLRRIKLHGRAMDLDTQRLAAADDWINDRFLFIAADPLGKNDDEIYLDWILERATDAVMRDGVQVFVIDPWNEIEHSRRPRESETEYIGRAIRMLNRFRHTYGVMVIVLLHPTKEVGKDGKSRPPTPYDAGGSANWFNKSDHFVIIHRPDEHLNEAMIRVAKVKFHGTGEKGTVRMKFDPDSSRFDLLDAGVDTPPVRGAE